MSDYARAFWRSLRARPARQSLRVLDFQIRRLFPRRLGPLDERSTAPASAALRPPPHHYQGYRGPWIEDFFCRQWPPPGPRPALRYLPVFWTDLYLHAQTHRFTPRQEAAFRAEIRALLDRLAETGQPHFTLLEYDHPIWDWHLFPKNVVVFSAGGCGDIPIPLLKGSPPFSCPPKDLPLSFVGRLDGASDATSVRSRLHAALRGHAVFARGRDWRRTMARSTFSLCPRGLGRASFRLYEALAVGSIPVYVWDDRPWLPYRDELDWNELAVSISIEEISDLPARLAAIPPERITAIQQNIARRYDEYFTLPGVRRQILRRVERLADPAEFARAVADR